MAVRGFLYQIKLFRKAFADCINNSNKCLAQIKQPMHIM